MREMTAMVKATTRRSGTVPAWGGGQMALSDLLSQHLRQEVDRCARALGGDAIRQGRRRSRLDTPELRALRPLLERQADLSAIPMAAPVPGGDLPQPGGQPSLRLSVRGALRA